MAFNLFKNPFENLSLENQAAMASSLQEIKDYFFKGNTIVQAVLELTAEVKKNIKEQDRLIQVLLKRQEKQMTDKDQKEMIKTMQLFGPAMQRIVGAIKDYSKLPEDVVDKFVITVEKLANAFEKAKELLTAIEDGGEALKSMGLGIFLFGLALLVSGPIYLLALPLAPIIFTVVLGFLYLYTKVLGETKASEIVEGGRGLMYMAGGIFLFGLALLLSGPLYLLALPLAPIVIGVVIGFLYLYTKVLGKETKGGNLQQGGQGLMYMAAGILLFGLALFLASFIYQQLWMGALGVAAILLTITAVIGIFYLINKVGGIQQEAAKTLLYMAGVIALFGLVLFIASFIYQQLWMGSVGVLAILLTIAAVVGIFYLIEKAGVAAGAQESAKALLYMAGVIGLFGLILFLSSLIYAELWTGTLGMLAILLTIAAVVGIFYLIESLGVAKSALESAKALLYMGAVIGLFGLILYLSSIIYAELWTGTLGMLAILLTIAAVVGIFYLIEAMGVAKSALESARALLYMAAAIGLFGLILYLASFIYAELWQGTLGVMAILLTIAAVIGLFWLIEWMGISDVAMKGAKALLYMAAVIGLVGLILYLASFIYAELWQGAVGVLAILLVIGALIGLMFLLDMLSDTIYDGVKALAWMVLVLVVVGLALYLISFVYEELWMGAAASLPILLVIGALIGLMFLIDMLSDTIYDGAKALLTMVFAFGLTAIVLYAISEQADAMMAGLAASWPILILILALVGIMFILDQLKTNIIMGALSLAVMSVAVLVLAGALAVLKAVDWTPADSLSLSVLLLVLALIGSVLGVLMEAGFLPLLGAAAIAAIGLAIIPLAIGLKFYKEAGWTGEDTVNLGLLIGALGLIATVLGNPFTSWMTLIGAAAMIAIGAAIVPLTEGLMNYKNSGWKESDNQKLIDTMAAVVRAFGIMWDEDLQKEAGLKPFEPSMVEAGVKSLSGIGNVMTSLAKGLVSFASMQFVEFEVVKDKDGNAKIQPKAVHKLTNADISNAATNFATVLNAILEPISNVGKAELEGAKWYQRGYVSTGIRALTGIGNIMTDLAKGVQSFADLKFTEYEIYKDKDGKTAIQPKAITQLTESHFKAVAYGFNQIVTSLLDPIKNVGAAEANSEGWFSGGYIKKGIEALTGIGNIMTELAKGVQSFADLKFTTFEIYTDPKTGQKSVQPSEMVKIDDGTFSKMSENFDKVVSAFLDPFLRAAFKIKEKEYDLNYATEYFPKITESIGKIADAATKWVTDITDKGVGDKMWTIMGVIDSMIDPILYVSFKIKEKEHDLEIFMNYYEDIFEAIGSLGETATKWMEVHDKGVADKMWSINGTINNMIDPIIWASYKIKENEEGIGIFMDNYEDIGEAIVKIGETASKWMEVHDKGVADKMWSVYPTVNQMLDAVIWSSQKIKDNVGQIKSFLDNYEDIIESIQNIGDAAIDWATDLTDTGKWMGTWTVYPVFNSILDPFIWSSMKFKTSQSDILYFKDENEILMEHLDKVSEFVTRWNESMTASGTWASTWTILPVLNSFFLPAISTGQMVLDNKEAYNGWIDVMKDPEGIMFQLARIRDEAHEWEKFQKPTQPGETFAHFTQSVFDAFRKPDYISIAARYQNFTDNMEVLIKGYDKIQKVADSFERIADAFGEMKDHINAMEIERLTQVTNLMGFLDGLANGESSDIVADIGEAITQGMQTLQDILLEIKDQLMPEAAPAAAPGTAGGVGPGTTTGTGAATAPAPGNQNQVLSQLQSTLSSLNATLKSGIKATVANSGSYVPTGSKKG